MPPKAARAAKLPEKPEETEAPEESARDLRLEDMDLENMRVSRTLVFLGNRNRYRLHIRLGTFRTGNLS